MQDLPNASIFRLEGRLTGEDAEHVRTLVTRCHIAMRLVVDLTEVTFIDAVGESALSLLRRLGAKFVAEDAYVIGVCQRLHLPLARKGKTKKTGSLVQVPGAPDHG
jgi:hypothetical protein